MDLRTQRRWQAVLIAAIFALPIAIALLLAVTGWAPKGRSYGQPIRPARDLASVPATLADGQPLAFTSHDATWMLLALPGPGCATRCLRQLDLAHRAQITLGQKADKMRLVYLGAPPAGTAAVGFEKVWTLARTSSHAFDDLRATAPDSVMAVLVNPAGKALTHYPAHFDAARLRLDMQKAVH